MLQRKIIAYFQGFLAYKLIFLCDGLSCLHVFENSWRKACWYAGRYWQTKARRSALSLLCWRHEVQNCQKYLTSIYEKSLQRTKKGGGVGGYRSDACSNKLSPCWAQYTRKNNVAWATPAPTVRCLPSKFQYANLCARNVGSFYFHSYFQWKSRLILKVENWFRKHFNKIEYLREVLKQKVSHLWYICVEKNSWANVYLWYIFN